MDQPEGEIPMRDEGKCPTLEVDDHGILVRSFLGPVRLLDRGKPLGATCEADTAARKTLGQSDATTAAMLSGMQGINKPWNAAAAASGIPLSELQVEQTCAAKFRSF